MGSRAGKARDDLWLHERGYSQGISFRMIKPRAGQNSSRVDSHLYFRLVKITGKDMLDTGSLRWLYDLALHYISCTWDACVGT